jgi:hypothetical protein
LEPSPSFARPPSCNVRLRHTCLTSSIGKSSSATPRKANPRHASPFAHCPRPCGTLPAHSNSRLRQLHPPKTIPCSPLPASRRPSLRRCHYSLALPRRVRHADLLLSRSGDFGLLSGVLPQTLLRRILRATEGCESVHGTTPAGASSSTATESSFTTRTIPSKSRPRHPGPPCQTRRHTL